MFTSSAINVWQDLLSDSMWALFCVDFLGKLFDNSIHLMVSLSKKMNMSECKLKEIFHCYTLLETKYECQKMLFASLQLARRVEKNTEK